MEKRLLTTLGLLAQLALPCPAAVLLDLDQPDARWDPVLSALAEQVPVHSRFDEARHNPFHKRPRNFSGDIHFHPDHGLRLAYTDPASLAITIDPEGIRIERPGQAPEIIPASGENEAMALLEGLIRWDTAWLSEQFTITGELSDDGWEMILEPRDPELARRLLRIRLQGTADLLNSIRLSFIGGRLVDISMKDTERPWQPDPDCLKKVFPTEK